MTSNILLALSQSASTRQDAITTTMAPHNSLKELEINGNHQYFYDPRLLLRFEWLTKISIIMPTTEVVKVLEEWVKIVNSTLKNLNVICKVRLPAFLHFQSIINECSFYHMKMSPRITDDILIRMAPSLKKLESLQLTGCPKVTHKGVRAVLGENENGITTLALEGVSPRLVRRKPFETLCLNERIPLILTTFFTRTLRNSSQHQVQALISCETYVQSHYPSRP